MAVQQNKKSPSKRGMHRAHDFLTAPALAVEPTTGEVNELTEGLKTDEADADWKKKSIYD